MSFTSYLLKKIASNRLYSISFVIIILFFPFELLDYIISAIANLGVVIFNAILWLLVIVINAIIWGINMFFGFIIQGLWDLGIEVVVEDGTSGDPLIPAFGIIEFHIQDWIVVDMFQPGQYLSAYILSLFNIDFRSWFDSWFFS